MKKLSKTKKIIVIAITVIALIIVGLFVSVPILNNIDRNNFEKLDKHQTNIYNNLVTNSNGSDVWNYSVRCKNIYAGSWPTGEFTCSTVISTEKQISSVDELNDLQSKYFSVIDQDTGLHQTSDLDIQTPQDFGKKFVVSSAEKHYTDQESGVGCWYSITLGQLNDSLSNSLQESRIEGDAGTARINLTCESKARLAWYSD